MQLLPLFIALIPLLNLTSAQSGVSGEMRMEEQFKGHSRVSQLSVGDTIRGIKGANRTPAWCKIEAVLPVPHTENQITYDGFTQNQMVVDNTVHPYGTKGRVRKEPVFTLATDCDAAINSAGQAFTPISSLLCPLQLNWSEYRLLIDAIRQVNLPADNFWYNLHAYHANETNATPDWADQLHDVCSEILQCKRDRHAKCQTFKKKMEKFVRKHLNNGRVEVSRQGPSLLPKGIPSGNAEVYYKGGGILVLAYVSIGVVAFVLLVALILCALMCRAGTRNSTGLNFNIENINF